jgi:hypothetical protein
VHTRERRAWARPMVCQGLALLTLLCAAVAADLLSFRLAAGSGLPAPVIRSGGSSPGSAPLCCWPCSRLPGAPAACSQGG